MARKTPSVPAMTPQEYAAIMEAHGQLNSEWQQPLSERAQSELQRFLGDESLEIPEDGAIDSRRTYFATRVKLLLDQYRTNEHWQTRLEQRGTVPAPVASTDEEIKSAPRTYIKTVQEVLSPRTATMAFTRAEAARNPRPIVDPARITPTLLRNLGLERFTPPARTRKTPAMVTMAGAIEDIQDMQSSLEPLAAFTPREMSKARSFRLMRVKDGKNEGYIVGTQMNHGKKIMFKADVHDAHRRVDHIRQGYNREIATLQDILTRIATVDAQVSQNWGEAKTKLPQLRNDLLECVKSLQHCSNAFKLRMRRKIEQCLTLQSERSVPERRGRMPDGTRGVVSPARKVTYLNPGAKRAIWNTLPDDVSGRIMEMEKIRSYVEQDQLAVKTHIEAMKPRSEFFDDVEKLHERFRILNPEKPLSPAERKQINGNLTLKVISHRLRGKSPGQLFEPYLSFGEAMCNHAEVTRDLLMDPPEKGVSDSRDPEREYSEKLATSFMRIYLLAKVEKFYVELQNMYDRHLVPEGDPDFDAILREIHELNTLLAAHRVKPDIKVPDFDAMYGELYHLLNSLRKKSRQGKALAGGETCEDFKSANQIKEALKERISSFRFDLLVRRLS